MKKIILLFIIISTTIFCDSLSINNLKKIEFVELGNWIELNFNKNKNVYWYELTGEKSEIYSISISGVNSKIFGKPSLSPFVYIYDENLNKIIQFSINEKPLLIEFNGVKQKQKFFIQVFSLKNSLDEKAYISINKINNTKNTIIPDDLEVQKFNENPWEFINNKK